MKNTFKIAGTILGIASAIFIISFMVLAWTGPSANPPAENIPVPLNVGTDTQAKQGALGIGGLLTVDRIQITGGNPGLGKVLTSGEDGLTTWEPFTGGSGIFSGTEAILFSNYNIGTADAFPKRVFVTSNNYRGNLGGLSGADNICNQLANTAGLGGTWRAWVSTSTVDAKDRIRPGIYRLTCGQEIILNDGIPRNYYQLVHLLPSSDIANFPVFDQYINIKKAISCDETGSSKSGQVWTGTGTDGKKYVYGSWNTTCSDWTISCSTASCTGLSGLSNRHDTKWTDDTIDWYWNYLCSSYRALYCFEQ
ncbi:MAG: hypothetical protein PHN37_00800 [Candidatus Pacebacteria bacterium]|nr:hypothetical protein [Candidatus Paceibacterota bacterium]